MASALPLAGHGEHRPAQKRVDQLIETPPLPSAEDAKMTDEEIIAAIKRPIAGTSWGKREDHEVAKRVNQLIETPALPSTEDAKMTDKEKIAAIKRPVAGTSWGKRESEDSEAM